MTVMRDAREGMDVIDSTPGDELPPFDPALEVGRSGLKYSSGYVNEEFLPQLRGRKAIQVFREMADNDPILGGFLRAVYELLSGIEYRVEAASSSSEDRANSKFVEQCMDDMGHSWADMITEIATFVVFGWELSEVCYKKRIGPWYTNEANENLHRSKYDDGKIGWSKIAGRSQETLLRWVFGDKGQILGMVQMAAPRYQTVPLSLRKCLLFRTTRAKNNPEGRSMLRNAYRPWFFLKRMQEIEAVGVERDLAGIPIAKVPPELFTAPKGSKEAAMLAAIKALVTGVRRNEQEGIVWPQDIDAETKLPRYEFDLLTSGGTRQFDIGGIIDRLKTEMLQSVLADFLMVGHEDNGGSYALHTDKSGLFKASLDSLAKRIADEFNRHAIPQLFELNGMKPRELPKMVPNKVDPPNLDQLAAFISATSAAGMQWFPDPELDKFLRQAAQVPALDPELEAMLEAQQRQTAVMNLAQQRLQAIQVEQQAVQGQMGMQQQALGMTQQQQQLEQGPEDPAAQGGAPAEQADPNDAKRSNIAVQTDKVKLDQEKAKLTNLRQQGRGQGGGQGAAAGPARGGRSAPTPSAPTRGRRQAVRKVYAPGGTISAFGVDHAPVRSFR